MATRIDESIPGLKQARKLTKADLSSKKAYQTFLTKHCQQGHYSFQIRRCNDETCCPGPPVPSDLHWLPYPMEDPTRPGHYQCFQDLYGVETTEELIPSQLNDVRKVSVEQQGCKASVLVGQNVRETIRCSECNKPRCIYSEKQLTAREERELRAIMRKYSFVCGCMITPDISSLSGVVFTRLELSCTSPIEYAYYAAVKVKCIKDLCAHCGCPGATKDRELVTAFKTVLPICVNCKLIGKESLKRGPLHTPAAKRALAKGLSSSNKKKK